MTDEAADSVRVLVQAGPAVGLSSLPQVRHTILLIRRIWGALCRVRPALGVGGAPPSASLILILQDEGGSCLD